MGKVQQLSKPRIKTILSDNSFDKPEIQNSDMYKYSPYHEEKPAGPEIASVLRKIFNNETEIKHTSLWELTARIRGRTGLDPLAAIYYLIEHIDNLDDDTQ